jgi:TonB-linked SusC/RagA family outer membrane protein
MRKSTPCFSFFLATIALSTTAFAQTQLTGTVKSTANEPLIGVNVVVKGTSVGTATDVDGTFRIQAPENATTLVISYIGFATQEVAIGQQTNFAIVLADDAKTLEEIVVTGYQSEERGKVLGAVSTVNPELVSKVPVSGIDQALQGRVAGVSVSQNTGAPGEGVSVRIRGVGSLNSNNNPLYVVDGIPTLDITSFSAQDVVSYNVLKDASAAAVYGSRAANGVVLITTKSGASNKQVIQISSQIGFQQPTRLVPMANTEQYASIYNEAAVNDTTGKPSFIWRPLITDNTKAGLPNVDQVKAIIRPNALLQTHSISISGGEGKTKYFISGSYFNQQGIIKASDYSRITARINVDTEVKKWLKTGVNLNISSATTDLVGSSGDGFGGNGGSVLRYAYFRTPAIPIFSSAAGDYTDLPSDNYNGNSLYNGLLGDGYNPVGMLAYNNNKKIADRIFGKFFAVIKPFEGFTFTSNLGIDYTNQNQRRFDRNWGTSGRINNPNRLVVTDDRNRTLTFSNFINYNKTFDKHGLTFLLGAEAIKASYYEVSATDMNFPNQNATLTYLNNGLALNKSVAESKAGNALLSYFGKIGYDYNQKYLASLTLRRDGSSRFGSNNRWGTFYAGSLGWRIDKESFLIDNTWMDKLLLRVGYGVIGNQEIPNYAFSDELGVTYPYSLGNTKNIGYAVSKLGNAKIQWESSSQLNAGVDLAMWNGKLSMSLDYFYKVTSKLLVNQPIASSSGLATPPVVNNGKVLNQGVELALNYSNKVGDFSYTISPNAALIRNEVLSVDSPIPGGVANGGYSTVTEKGYPIGSFYMLEMEGIFQNQNDIFTHASQGSSGSIKPGDVKFKDQNQDAKIDLNNDRKHLGSAIPKVTGGLNVMMGYKNFDLSVFFQGAYGQKILSVLNRDIEGFYRAFNVTERYYTNHWTPEHPNNQYPRASWDASGNNAQISSRFLEKGSYTRLKNIQIGYSLPKEVLQRYGFSALRIYLSGTNLFTFTKYSGMDPEMTVSDNSKTEGDKANGIDWGTYPAAKSYNFGVNLTF